MTVIVISGAMGKLFFHYLKKFFPDLIVSGWCYREEAKKQRYYRKGSTDKSDASPSSSFALRIRGTVTLRKKSFSPLVIRINSR